MAHIPAQGAHPDTGGIGGIKETFPLDRFLKIRGDHARLDDADAQLRIDRQDPVHPFEAQQNAAPNAESAAGTARTRAPSHDRDPLPMGETDQISHLAAFPGKNDRIGDRPAEGGVVAVAEQILLVNAKLPAPQIPPEIFGRGCG